MAGRTNKGPRGAKQAQFPTEARRALKSNPPTATNRKLADRYADVKRSIAFLEAELDGIRKELVALGGAQGDEFEVRVDVENVKRFDREKAERKFGKAAVEECYAPKPATYVRIYHKTDGVFS